MIEEDFLPVRPLRNPHLQSVLASTGPRQWIARARAAALTAESQACLLDCGDGVRLQGFHCPAAPGSRTRGLTVLLHGWEGCAGSAYVLSSAARLRRAGFETFRLNFRDHGDTHHLNEGIFHSCRIREAVGAVAAVARRFSARPLSIVGFSLGGNFALRIALRAPQAGIPLARVAAVSPVIDPVNGLRALDGGPFFYQRYFVRRWNHSLRRKQACFPDRYDFREWYPLTTVRDKTRWLIERFGPFATLEEYLHGYSIAGEVLAALEVPATVITAEDDPIIPVADFGGLRVPECVEVQIVRYGGHCGFISDFSLASWAERRILAALCG